MISFSRVMNDGYDNLFDDSKLYANIIDFLPRRSLDICMYILKRYDSIYESWFVNLEQTKQFSLLYIIYPYFESE